MRVFDRVGEIDVGRRAELGRGALEPGVEAVAVGHVRPGASAKRTMRAGVSKFVERDVLGPDLDAGLLLDEGDEVEHRHRIERAVGEQLAVRIEAVAEREVFPQIADQLCSVSAIGLLLVSAGPTRPRSAATASMASRRGQRAVISGRASLPLAVRGIGSGQRWKRRGTM